MQGFSGVESWIVWKAKNRKVPHAIQMHTSAVVVKLVDTLS